MTLNSPPGRPHAPGSARTSAQHWWLQRISAVALIPLIIWLTVSIARLAGSSHSDFAIWVSAPWNAALLLLAITITFYHLKVGLDVVIQDYVHTRWLKNSLLFGNCFAAIMVGSASAFAVVQIAL